MTDIITLRRILTEYKRVAMVGLSADWWRPSFFAAKYLLEHGFEVIPVNPKYDEILEQKCYPDLKSIPTPSVLFARNVKSLNQPKVSFC